jgi:hypothetical protein
MELSATTNPDKRAAEAAAAAREAYREQLRANKKRIAESLQDRKSLMERHDAVRRDSALLIIDITVFDCLHVVFSLSSS